MSDDKVSLEFLGEQMRRMQLDLRGIRTDHMRLEEHVRGLDGKIDAVDAKVDRVDAKVDRVDARVDRVERKLDGFIASVDERFEQANRTAATNLDIVLKAIDVNK
jgi:peptidoglycan hydrolase CwlO-like protein